MLNFAVLVTFHSETHYSTLAGLCPQAADRGSSVTTHGRRRKQGSMAFGTKAFPFIAQPQRRPGKSQAELRCHEKAARSHEAGEKIIPWRGRYKAQMTKG